jgi:hypothetical protein
MAPGILLRTSAVSARKKAEIQLARRNRRSRRRKRRMAGVVFCIFLCTSVVLRKKNQIKLAELARLREALREKQIHTENAEPTGTLIFRIFQCSNFPISQAAFLTLRQRSIPVVLTFQLCTLPTFNSDLIFQFAACLRDTSEAHAFQQLANRYSSLFASAARALNP